MQVTNWPIEKVIPYENNPRKNDDAVEYVANSIREFGFQQPLVVDSEGVLIVGHTRLKAAQRLGLTEVPVTVAEGLTPNQIEAYRLTDNKVSEFAQWDFDKLNIELEGIDWLETDMTQFGFYVESMDGLTDSFSIDTGEEPRFRTMTLHFDNSDYDFVSSVLDRVKNDGTYSDKVLEVCRQWAGR